ncbi:hypothetical protein Bbelb_004120 [Branchiostoma belcheri]|nr:hypothetical protein Bbelb_004120 [Branchiostoma belcheri]
MKADLTQELQTVADNIGSTDWRRLLRRLGLKDNDLDQIHHDYMADGLAEKAYQGLRKWRQREGKKATLQELKAGLEKIRRRDLIDMLSAGRPPDTTAEPSVPSHIQHDDLTERTLPKQPVSDGIPSCSARFNKRKHPPRLLKTLVTPAQRLSTRTNTEITATVSSRRRPYYGSAGTAVSSRRRPYYGSAGKGEAGNIGEVVARARDRRNLRRPRRLDILSQKISQLYGLRGGAAQGASVARGVSRECKQTASNAVASLEHREFCRSRTTFRTFLTKQQCLDRLGRDRITSIVHNLVHRNLRKVSRSSTGTMDGIVSEHCRDDCLTSSALCHDTEGVTSDLTQELQTVADDIGSKDWRRLLRRLGLKDNDLEQIYHDYSDLGIVEMAYQGLRKWKQQGGEKATLQKLLSGLEKIRRRDLVDMLCASRYKYMEALAYTVLNASCLRVEPGMFAVQ